MAKFATVRAIKGFVAASIRFLKAFRQWDPGWQYHPGDPCFYHGVGYCANPGDIPAAGESPESCPAKWNVIGGAESGATFTPTPNRVTKFDDDARLRSGGEAVDPDHVIRKRELNLRVTTLQLCSKKSLLMSNARQALRRQRGWDLGIPYLSPQSEVYHFDTDLLNQHQLSAISVEQEGEVSLLPSSVILDYPPFEIISRSLYGKFSVNKIVPASESSTVEFWTRISDPVDLVLFQYGIQSDNIRLTIGKTDPEYSTAAPGDILYCVSDSQDLNYSFPRAYGNSIVERITDGKIEIIDVSDLDIPTNTWIHIAVVNTQNAILLYVDNKSIAFEKSSTDAEEALLIINGRKCEFNLDELMIDPAIALSFDSFLLNTAKRIPYAALDYQQKWFVLEAEDAKKVKTNLFETDAFREAVLAILTPDL